jgi:hypothetical protein
MELRKGRFVCVTRNFNIGLVVDVCWLKVIYYCKK